MGFPLPLPDGHDDGGRGGNSLVTAVPFDFEGKSVRTIAKKTGIWFAATDACAVPGISNVSDVVTAIRRTTKRGGKLRSCSAASRAVQALASGR
jgi:prophage antirepressor-like protein